MAPLPASPLWQNIQPFVGYARGQSLSVGDSYAFVWANGPTVHVVVHLEATNQANKQLRTFYKLDGKAPVASGVAFTTDGKGSATTHFAVGNLVAGQHDIVVEINDDTNAGTLYISSGANNQNAAPGISFTI
ncbi:hypothetical protein [Nocardia asteroides]|uniref:hypothetical protein n=1 Tax=Nocardia asteroides TaxID=1824 RepID=UPI001E3740D4|nr:hypothetical protein [Nocardia asteroides]UGT62537.1 hypothetical protein LTT61_04090 [Nocardia asteroides]